MFFQQKRVPLLEAIINYIDSNPARFHVPGHGGGRGAPEDITALAGTGFFAMDVTELPGLDDLNSPAGVIAQAQELAAQAFGAEHSFFLVNGTTSGLQALILAVGRPGGVVILPRNVHRSVIGGLVLAGLNPVFVAPAIVPDFHFAAGIPPEEISKAISSNPGASAVLCIHPTYYGTVGDTKKITQLAHAAGIPVLCDEAHGCHFYFHEGYPAGALQLEADAVVQSMHKTGGSLTQSSFLHLKSTLMDEEKVASALKLIQTSSPSYVLMASLDTARRRLALEGRHLLEELLQNTRIIREKLAVVPGIQVFGPESFDGEGVCGYDPSRLVIRVSGLGLTGHQAADWLQTKHGVFSEMADHHNVVLVPGLGLTPQDCHRLVAAMRDLSLREGKYFFPKCFDSNDRPPSKAVMPLREAWFATSRAIPLREAVGSVCAEWVAVYPPGIPVMIPGEEVTFEMVNYLLWARESGLNFQGPADPELKTIQVIM